MSHTPPHMGPDRCKNPSPPSLDDDLSEGSSQEFVSRSRLNRLSPLLEPRSNSFRRFSTTSSSSLRSVEPRSVCQSEEIDDEKERENLEVKPITRSSSELFPIRIYSPGLVGSIPGYSYTGILACDFRLLGDELRFRHEGVAKDENKTFLTSDHDLLDVPRRGKRKASEDEEVKDVGRLKRPRNEDLKSEEMKLMKMTRTQYPRSSFGCLENDQIPLPIGFKAHRMARHQEKLNRERCLMTRRSDLRYEIETSTHTFHSSNFSKRFRSKSLNQSTKHELSRASCGVMAI